MLGVIQNREVHPITGLFMIPALLLNGSGAFAQDNMTAEHLIARHLESIGTPEALARVKSRQVTGPLKSVTYRGWTWTEKQGGTMISAGPKFKFIVSRHQPGFKDEVIAFDGVRLLTGPEMFREQSVPSFVSDFPLLVKYTSIRLRSGTSAVNITSKIFPGDMSITIDSLKNSMTSAE